MRPTTVLLDAGGVILDESDDGRVRIETAVEILRGAVPEYGAEILLADLEEAIQVFCPRVLAYAFWKRTAPDRHLFERLYQDFMKTWRPRRPPLKLMPGLKPELRAIAQEYDVGIAGQYGRELIDLLRRESVVDLFTYRFTQDDFAITKPDPRYLEKIARACGVRPEECIMVGDRMDNDIIPAKHLGMKTILVRVGLHKNQQPRIPWEMPDAELESVAGLADAVLRAAGVDA